MVHPKTAGGNSATPRKLCNFYPRLSLETVFPALKLPQNCYIMNIGSPTHHILFLRDNPHNVTKYESKGILKIPISELLSESEGFQCKVH